MEWPVNRDCTVPNEPELHLDAFRPVVQTPAFRFRFSCDVTSGLALQLDAALLLPLHALLVVFLHPPQITAR